MTADIDLTVAKIAAQPDTVTRSYIAAVAITAGAPVYFLAAGTVGLADSNDAGKEQFFGIALETVGAGSAVTVAHEGVVDGFDVSGNNAGALIYVSANVGRLSDTGVTKSVPVGKVIGRSDGTKTIYFKTNWLATY